MGLFVFILGQLAFKLFFIGMLIGIELFTSVIAFILPRDRIVETLRRLKPGSPAAAMISKVVQRLRKASVILCATTVAVLLMVNLFYTENVMRWFLSAISSRTEINIRYQALDGNLLTGRFNFKGISIDRSRNNISEFSFECGNAIIDVNISALLLGKVKFDEVAIANLRGKYSHMADFREHPARKGFEITTLKIDDAIVSVEVKSTARRALNTTLIIEELHSTRLRSQWALYDLLFGTCAKGAIDDGTFAIRTAVGNAEWTANNLPIGVVFSQMLHPLNLIEDGRLSVHVISNWTRERYPVIEMKCELVLSELSPLSVKSIMDIKPGMTAPRFLNDNRGSFPIAFQIAVDQRSFEFACSAEAAGIWKAFSAKIIGALGIANKSDAAILEKALEATGNAFQEFKSRAKKNP